MPITTPVEVIRTQIATHNASSPVGTEIMSAQQGRSSRSGEVVQAAPNNSDLSDALEEMGMAVASRGKGDLDKMKMRKSQGSNLEALSRIAEYYEKLPNLPSDQKNRDLVMKFQKFEDAMRFKGRDGGDKMPTAEELMAALREYDGDVTHQFAAIEDLRLRAEKSEAPQAYLDLLDTVRREMRTPDAVRDIAAGFGSAVEAARVGDRFGSDPQSYRDSYRTLLRDSTSLGRTFDELRGFNISESFDEIVDSFMQTAGDELSNAGSFIEPAQLGSLLNELSSLKNLRSVYDASGEFLNKINRMYPPEINPARPNSEDITSRLFHFSGSPVASVNDAERLLTGFEKDPPDVPVVAINLLRDLHASLPDSVIASPQARDQQSRLLMSLSDKFVEIEEAAFGG